MFGIELQCFFQSWSGFGVVFGVDQGEFLKELDVGFLVVDFGSFVVGFGGFWLVF